MIYMTAKAFIDTNIYIYALTQSQDQNDDSKRMIVLSVFETLISS
jgi:predicted nucleic acid-binding protein